MAKKDLKKSAPAETKEAAAPAAEKKEAAKKPAAKKPAAPKAAAADKKPAAKRGRKPAADKKPAAKKTAAPKAAESKAGRKPKGLAYNDIVAAAQKKILAADITKIKYPIAANVELTGKFTENPNPDENGSNRNVFYINIDPDNQEISVEPYRYNDYDVTINADAEELMNVLKGKKNIYDALSEGIHIHGNTKKAVLLIHSAF
ncbi:MAG: hypothetical protein J1F11_08570 [Oscillospiraceae bacterium]|nr:hypothetical protein [Oscillospiraceae bacterium]